MCGGGGSRRGRAPVALWEGQHSAMSRVRLVIAAGRQYSADRSVGGTVIAQRMAATGVSARIYERGTVLSRAEKSKRMAATAVIKRQTSTRDLWRVSADLGSSHGDYPSVIVNGQYVSVL